MNFDPSPSATRHETRGSPHLDALWMGVALALHLLYFQAFQYHRVFWRDEAHAWNLSSGPWPDFLRLFAYVEHQTGYLVVLRLLGTVFANPMAACLLSLACTLGGAWILYRLANRLFDDPVAARAAWILTLLAHPLLTYSSGSIRPYAFAFLLQAVIMLGVLGLFRRFTTAGWIGWSCVILLSVNSQPVNLIAAYAVAGVWTLAGLREWVRPRPVPTPLRAAARIMSIPVSAVLASIPMVMQSMRFSEKMKGVEPAVEPGSLSLSLLAKTLLGLLDSVLAPAHLFIQYAWRFDPGASVRALVGHPATAVIALLISAGAVYAVAKSASRRSLVVVPPLLLLVATATGLWLASIFHVRMVEELRSFSALGPPAILLAGWLLARTGMLRHLVIAAMLFHALAGWSGFRSSEPGRQSDALQAARFVNEHAQPGDLVVLANAQIGPSFSIYIDADRLRQVHHPYDRPVTHWDMVELGMLADAEDSFQQTASAIMAARDAGGRVWLVDSGSPAPEPDRYWYSPRTLPRLESLLGEHFEATESLPERSRLEPMRVTLFAAPQSGEGP